MRSIATLARWLGPWAADTAAPRGVKRRVVRVPAKSANDREFDAWLYTPKSRATTGAYIIAPGLHYAGPSDPRMNRFCAILASAGFVVLAPFLPDYTALRVDPRAVDDFARAFTALRDQPEAVSHPRPAVFSISFGSLLALRLAADRDDVAGLVLFGGYADWSATIRYALTGEVNGAPHGARDPLNQPVVVMNLLDDMDDVPADRARLEAAWRAYVEATWGRPEMKADGRYQKVALGMVEDLPEDLREWFLMGIGVRPGATKRCLAALHRFDSRSEFLDPRPHLARIRCPTHIVHGVDDDVIPYPQAHELAEALPSQCDPRVYLTGLYGHTAQAGIGAKLRNLPVAARELATLAKMLRAIVATGCD